MSETISRFNYNVIKMNEGVASPFDPYVEIVLDNWVCDTDSVPTISPRLMTDTEIDSYIQHLKDDLDAVANKAKVALQIAKTDTRTNLPGKNSN